MALSNHGEGMHYEGRCIRPPSEANSILLQATLGCSHNKCTFCGTYKEKGFRIKDNDIILSDILYASRHMRSLERLFIMDGDALIIPYPRLKWIMEMIKEHLPQVKRVGVYANSKGVRLKSDEQLRELTPEKIEKMITDAGFEDLESAKTSLTEIADSWDVSQEVVIKIAMLKSMRMIDGDEEYQEEMKELGSKINEREYSPQDMKAMDENSKTSAAIKEILFRLNN